MSTFANFDLESALFDFGNNTMDMASSSPFAKYRNGGRGIQLFVSMVDTFLTDPTNNRAFLISEFHAFLVSKSFKSGTKSASLLDDSWSRFLNFNA